MWDFTMFYACLPVRMGSCHVTRIIISIIFNRGLTLLLLWVRLFWIFWLTRSTTIEVPRWLESSLVRFSDKLIEFVRMIAAPRISSIELVIVLTPIYTSVISPKRSIHLVIFIQINISASLYLGRLLNIYFRRMLCLLGVCQFLQFHL